ncbi:MAG TPA: hypothetical protein VHQ64_10000 [Pyrinomonadaceae bacterium]|jgi:hypothetical protein|nr:hypothetical protein [Pyrinomonadaceae bacterium]
MREFGLLARALRQHENEKLMKKTSHKRASKHRSRDLQPEYDFDYSKAKPNRFAGRIAKDQTVVLLDPEVSKVFNDSESVNAALRALIDAFPKNIKQHARK